MRKRCKVRCCATKACGRIWLIACLRTRTQSCTHPALLYDKLSIPWLGCVLQELTVAVSAAGAAQSAAVQRTAAAQASADAAAAKARTDLKVLAREVRRLTSNCWRCYDRSQGRTSSIVQHARCLCLTFIWQHGFRFAICELAESPLLSLFLLKCRCQAASRLQSLTRSINIKAID